MTTKRPTRKAIKQAIRNVARLTGITIRQARPLIGDKVFLRNTDHFVKAKRCYPVAVSDPGYNTDLGVPFEVTFEFQKNGKFINPQPSTPKPPSCHATPTPVARLTSKLIEPISSGHLLAPPMPMKPITPEKMKEMMATLRSILEKAPKTIIVSTPSRRNDRTPMDDVVFITSPEGQQPQDQKLTVLKQRPNTNPNFTFEVPTSWKTLDDKWSELLNDKNFFNEKPKDS